MQPVETIPVANVLGECVLWDDRAETVWWTDISGRCLHCRDWHTGALQVFPTPHRLASFGFVEGARSLIAAFDCGIAIFDPYTAEIGPFLRPEGLSAGHRLNDGRVDRQGRFWFGSMVEQPGGAADARLYRFAGGSAETHLRGIGIANGLCWSPDGRWVYFADSRQGVIWRSAFDVSSGRLGEREVFAKSEGGAVPDGATVDAEGFVWSAQWGGSAVVRYAPDGQVDRVLALPVSQPTCVAFGGEGLDHLFVTTARCDLARPETGAGDLFVYNVGVRGLPESRFIIDG